MPTRTNIRVAAIAAAVSIVLTAAVAAEGEADNQANIKRIGEVNVAGSAPAAAPAATPAAAAAPASDGAALYMAKTCNACHGADGNTTIMPTYPRIGGQGVEYLVAQMKDIKSGARNNAQSGVMKGIIANVSEEEMRAIAEWLATQ